MTTPSPTGTQTAPAPSRLRTRRTTAGTGDLLDTELIRRRRQELGLSREEVARASDLALTALARIEDGRAGDGVTLGQLAKLAETLGLETRTLLRPAAGEKADEPSTTGIDRDVAELACLLLVAHTSLSRDIAARALGWPLTRVMDTLTRLETEAPNLGVQLVRHGYSVRLTRTGDWNRVIKLATLQREDAVARATKARTARLVHALHTRDPDAATATADILSEAHAGHMVDGPTHHLTARTRHALTAPDLGQHP